MTPLFCTCRHRVADHSVTPPHRCLIGSRISAHYTQAQACACAALEEVPVRADDAPPPRWTGPREGEVDELGCIIKPPLPPERWPYGPPDQHEDCCILHDGGPYCDCKASSADPADEGWGKLA